MQTKIPARKVMASTLGTAFGVLLIYGLETTLKHDIPTGVEGAIYTIATFVLGYFTPPAAIDQINTEGSTP